MLKTKKGHEPLKIIFILKQYIKQVGKRKLKIKATWHHLIGLFLKYSSQPTETVLGNQKLYPTLNHSGIYSFETHKDTLQLVWIPETLHLPIKQIHKKSNYFCNIFAILELRKFKTQTCKENKENSRFFIRELRESECTPSQKLCLCWALKEREREKEPSMKRRTREVGGTFGKTNTDCIKSSEW